MHFSKEEKAMWLEDWRQSGKRVWPYAKENGLCPQTFARWTKPKTENKSCFVQLPKEVIPPLQYPGEILIEKGEMRIHIPLSLGTNELRVIFSALEGAV